jgi:predicted PurR-regulated permease PerM
MKVRIQIETETFVRFWLVVAGLILAAIALYSARTGLLLLGTALFLALALNAPVSKLANYLPGKSRIGSTAIAFVMIVAFIGTFIFLAVPPIIQQTAKFAETVPSLVQNVRERSQVVNRFIHEYNLQDQVDKSAEDLKSSASKWASNAGSNLLSGIGSVFSAIAATFLVLVLTFLMLVEGPGWMKRFWGLYEDRRRMEYHRTIVQRMHRVVSSFIVGQLTISALGAVCAGIAVFVLTFFFPIPANLAIPVAALTFILSLIPMFGSTIAGAVAALLLFFNSAPAAIIYVIYFIVYQQIENNFISPTIQAKHLSLSPLAILAGLTVGLYMFGLIGGLISIPITGCIKILIEEYLVHAKTERAKDDKPLNRLVKKVEKV